MIRYCRRSVLPKTLHGVLDGERDQCLSVLQAKLNYGGIHFGDELGRNRDLQSCQCVVIREQPFTSAHLRLPHQPFGVSYRTRASASAAERGGRDEATLETNTRTLGLVMGDSGAGLPVVKVVLSGSSAWQAGLSAGDTLIAIDGLRASALSLSKHLARFKAGASIAISYFRHDLLREATVIVPVAKADSVWLPLEGTDSAALARRQKWLSQG